MKIHLPLSKSKSQGSLVVLLAALHPEPAVLEILHGQVDLIVREAYSVRGTMQDLAGVQLVILDHLLSITDSPIEVLRQTLEANQIPCVSQEEFLRAPREWLGRAELARSGQVQFLPGRQVCLTGWAGGVGKTTLSLALAKRFFERTGLPAAVLELSSGPGSLAAVTGMELPDFFSLLTQNVEPGKWQGVSLHPMDGRAFEVLRAEGEERIREYILELQRRYTLLVTDSSPAHPFFTQLSQIMPGLIHLVVTTPRVDSISQGQKLQLELTQPAHWIMNQSASPVDGLSGVAARIPFREHWAANFDAHLADPLLALIYSGWAAKSC